MFALDSLRISLRPDLSGQAPRPALKLLNRIGLTNMADQYLKKAIDIVQEAIKADNEGRLEDAFNL